MTPLEADRLIRVEQAKHLLATTRRSATQIATDTGFCDLPHLIRVFRAAEGMTPEVFRRTRFSRMKASCVNSASVFWRLSREVLYLAPRLPRHYLAPRLPRHSG